MITSTIWAMMHKLHIVLGLVFLTIVATSLAVFSLYLNDFSVTPDIAGLVCAGDHLAKTGTIRNYPLPPSAYEMCWQPATYPLLQQAFAMVERFSDISSIHLALLLVVISYVGVVLTTTLVTWQLSRHIWVTAISGGFTMVTPALIRSMLLTPQNTIGYLLLLLMMSCLLAFTVRRQWLYAVPVMAIIGLTYYVHSLTFAIMTFIAMAWFLIVAIRPWWLQLSLTATGLVGFASQLLWHWLPTTLNAKIAYFLHGSSAGFNHPLWDHAAIWGYLMLALAAVGFFHWPLQRPQRITLAIVGIIPTVLGHLSVFGVGILPNRFIPFSWLALTPLAALGAVYLVAAVFGKTWYNKLWSGLTLGGFMASAIAHGLLFMMDDISGLAFRYTPRPGYVEALTWLNQNDPTATVLGVQSAANQEVLVSAMWYDGLVLYYPWYALNHRNLKKFAVINKSSSPYTNVVTNPNDPLYPWLHDYYTIVAKPNSVEATSAVQNQKLDYFITSKNSKVYTEVWQQANPDQYPVTYENDHYIIYTFKNSPNNL